MKLLDNINKPNDIKKISSEDYGRLAKEIRSFLVSKISRTGGHLASNLGTVELTMALHLFLDLPKDKLIWDVGHQSYTHKILTGRKDEFESLRQFSGMSGFPKRSESDCDAFDTGHSSTSVSVAAGIMKARDLKNEDYKVVAVIGDGALSGGMAFEALNNVGRFKSNMIVILNDNNMSISENVGGMATYLGRVRTNSRYGSFKMNLEERINGIPVIGESVAHRLKQSKDSIKSLFISGMLFENMGLTYIGPIDGHNIPIMLSALRAAEQSKTPVLIHVVTKKGKGYRPAEENPSMFHGVEPFDRTTGLSLCKNNKKSYTNIFSEEIISIAENDPSVVAVSAAMADGTGLSEFKNRYPDRFFDVGIAEEHAVTFAAGMASQGLHPVVAIYSTFLQRSYDQIIHDVCINRLPVTFAIDRAGIVGNDGETHQGIFDISYLSHIPGMTVMAPKNAQELKEMLNFACSYDGPVAIRYPRGEAYEGISQKHDVIVHGKSEIIKSGIDVAIFAVGNMNGPIYNICERLTAQGIDCTHINVRFISPLDYELIDKVASEHKLIITAEENVKRGGFGEMLAAYIKEKGYDCRYMNLSLPDNYLVHGNPEQLRKFVKLDEESMERRIIAEINKLN